MIAPSRQMNGHAPPAAFEPLRLPEHGPVSGWPQQDEPGQSRTAAGEPGRRGAASVRVVESCYAAMAVVTIIATAVGFWLSYAGLHSFAVLAGLSGPEAWAWPASVDLFILAGELGITISTLRDGRPDWRAWGYFVAGCGPSVTFNVTHVFSHFPPWGKYAVAATPPVAAVLALAALMQQIISLPDALRHMHARQQQAGTVPSGAIAPSAAGGSLEDKTEGSRPDKKADKSQDKSADKTPSRKVPARTGRDRAADIIRGNPGWDNARVAAQAGCDVRTVRRARSGLARTGQE